jgi:bacillithiol biosynthesis deacetylase BshB1
MKDSIAGPLEMTGNNLYILAFSPHPDDAELGCGGSILLAVQRGIKVGVADMSEGEHSSCGSPEERRKEKEAASGLLGINDRFSLNLPDGGIGTSPAHRLALVDLIRKVRPRIVLAPYGEDRHPDHEAAGRLVREASFFAGVADIGKGQPFRPDRVYYYMSHSPFTPAFVIDISPVWTQKLAVIGAYRTQFFNDETGVGKTAISDPAFLRYHESRSVYFGAMIGVPYGEPYYSTGPLGFGGLPGSELPRSTTSPWSPQYRCF